MLGVSSTDQIRVEEEVQGCDGWWDLAMRDLTRSGVNALGDVSVNQIYDNEEERWSSNVE
jgi:hypothetical protein